MPAAEAGLPAPTCTVINPENGRGHLIYGLAVPVLLARETGPAAALPRRRGAGHYHAPAGGRRLRGVAVQESAASVLGRGMERPLLLPAGSTRLAGRSERVPGDGAHRGCGPHVETFDAVRAWACPGGDGNVLQPKADGGSLDTWRQACTGAAEAFTAAHHRPELQRSECRWIGRSIAKWTWARITQERFSRSRQHAGRGGKRSRRNGANANDVSRSLPSRARHWRR